MEVTVKVDRNLWKIILPLLFIAGAVLPGFADQAGSNVSIYLTPSVSLPIGESSSLFNTGGGGNLTLAYPVPGMEQVYVKGGLGFTYLPVQADTSLSEISLSGGVGYELSIIPLISLFADADAGYYIGVLPLKSGQTSLGTGFLAEGGGGLSLNLNQGVSIRLGAAYKYDASLYNGVKFFITAALRQGSKASGKTNLEIRSIDIQRIFPVFYKYYDANSLGSITIKNLEPGPIGNLQVSFYVNQFMERPKLSTGMAGVGSGEVLAVPLYGLFRDDVFSLFEETAVSGEIVISYEYNGEEKRSSIAHTVYIANRNSVTWDDDRKAAAFVQSRDPGIIKVGKNVANIVKNAGSPTLTDQFTVASGIFTALKRYGISYVPDPTTPYEKLSKDDKAIDYLQFPWQTLEYKSGDCDDMSILYASLIESAGVDAAFVTVPGHIYSAFRLGLPESDTKRLFPKPDNFIFLDGETWVPVETTLLSAGFTAAWKDGARQWREHSRNNNAALIRIKGAWDLYKPVGFRTNADKDFTMPGDSDISGDFIASVNAYRENEIRDQELASRSLYKAGSPESQNWLGVFNYRLGNTDRAIQILRKVLVGKPDYVPALVNMGNMELLAGNFRKAQEYFQTANTTRPGNPVILMAIAKTYYRLEETDQAKELYQKVAAVDPGLAKQNSYIIASGSDSERASAQTVKGEDLIWINE